MPTSAPLPPAVQLVAAAVLILLGLGLTRIPPSPPAAAPTAPRSSCADLKRAVDSGGRDLLVVSSPQLGFELAGDTRRFHCESLVFPATSLPTWIPGQVSWVEGSSEVMVRPAGGGAVGLGSVCHGCSFASRQGRHGFRSAEGAAALRRIAPLPIALGLLIVAFNAHRYWRKRQQAS
jgi:hypothetical protein